MEIDLKKLTTLKDMGNGLIRVSNRELLERYPEQFDEFERLILDPDGYTETLTPAAIAAAHARSQQEWDALAIAEKAALVQTMPMIKKIALTATRTDINDKQM